MNQTKIPLERKADDEDSGPKGPCVLEHKKQEWYTGKVQWVPSRYSFEEQEVLIFANLFQKGDQSLLFRWSEDQLQYEKEFERQEMERKQVLEEMAKAEAKLEEIKEKKKYMESAAKALKTKRAHQINYYSC